MSADNWAACPRCLARARAEKARLVQEAQDSYGKVTPDEYLQLRDRSEQPVELDNSLREDYSFYLDEETGKFTATYRSRCSNTDCGLNFSFNHQEQVQV